MKRKGDPISGILVLDKAISQGSTQAVAKLKYLFNAQKAGHGGTLDPMATGLLPILFGEATKFANDLLGADKTYEATVLLGITTDSADAEGHITAQHVVQCTAEQIEAACQQFRGDIDQVPPMYSALKRDGKPLYEYAREGIEFELESRKITVYEMTVLAVRLPEVDLRIHCSKGTYIRSIARDLGDALGCGGHLIALRRTQAGPLRLQDAIDIASLQELSVDARREKLLPLDTLLQGLPRLDLDAFLAQRFCQGQRIALADLGLSVASIAKPNAEQNIDQSADDSSGSSAEQNAAEVTQLQQPQKVRVYLKSGADDLANNNAQRSHSDAAQLLGLAHLSASALEPARVIHSFL
jgi:tRNA pseudouridine55 synthase